MAYRQYRRNQSARGRRSRRSSAPRRTLHWYRNAEFGVTPDIQAVGASVADLLPDTVLDPGARLGATVERIHLTCRARWGISTTIAPNWRFFVGIYVGPGLTPQPPPDPGSRANEVDWMLWRALSPQNAGTFSHPAETGPPAVGNTFTTDYDFDVKSKRRFYEPTDKIWLVCNTTGELGIEAGIQPMFAASVLIRK